MHFRSYCLHGHRHTCYWLLYLDTDTPVTDFSTWTTKVVGNNICKTHLTNNTTELVSLAVARLVCVDRLDSFLRRCRRLGYCEQSQPSIAELYSDIDDTFFSRIMSNSKHILQQFLHDRTTTYSLRSRNHSKVLVNKTSYSNDSDFLIRLLYKYSY